MWQQCVWQQCQLCHRWQSVLYTISSSHERALSDTVIRPPSHTHTCTHLHAHIYTHPPPPTLPAPTHPPHYLSIHISSKQLSSSYTVLRIYFSNLAALGLSLFPFTILSTLSNVLFIPSYSHYFNIISLSCSSIYTTPYAHHSPNCKPTLICIRS